MGKQGTDSTNSENGTYWGERMSGLEEEQHQRGEAYYQDLQEQFRRAKNEIQMDIERWYQRLAENNGVSLAAAKRLLKKNELEEFQWTVEQYMKYGEKNALDPKWKKQLENASARHHISYLEALKCQMQQHVEQLMTEYEGGVTDFLHKTYAENYYHSAYEIAKGIGVGSNFAQLDEKRIDVIIKKPWAQDGKNFSDRIWTNKQKLTSHLHTELSQCIIRGDEPAKAISRLSEIMDVSERQAGRLVMTEAAAISSVAKKDCFQELDVEEFQFVATLDRHTSELCQSMDGKHFKMSEYQIGVNVPPLHCWCRSCTVPYFGDEFTEGEQRAARDEDGKTYYVPANMTYPEWKEKFVDNVVKDSSIKFIDISEEINSDRNSNNQVDIEKKAAKALKKIKKKINSIKDFYTRNKPPITLNNLEIDSTYAQSIWNVINFAPKSFQRAILRNADEIIFAKINAVGPSHFNSEQGIYINLKRDFVNIRGQWTTLFHEMGHNIDYLYGNPSENSDFINALKEEFFQFTKVYQKQYNVDIEEAYKVISHKLRVATDEESHILSDLFEGLSNGACVGKWKHESNYWNLDEKIGKEAFAHFFSASVTNNQVKIDSIKNVFPEAYSKFLHMVGGMK